ncbi:Alginate lyase [Abortiporus biennis]
MHLTYGVYTLLASLVPCLVSGTPLSNLTSKTSLSNSLFPVSPQQLYWTTSTTVSGATVSPLSDATFRPHNQISALKHPYVNAPDGRLSMQAHYPAGSYNFQNSPQGGFSFYAPGPSNVDLTTAKEVTFGYTAFFPSGFNFVKGGKVPGLYGGNSDSEAVSCSGGRRDDGCFSVRMMWRTAGAGEIYTYLPPDFDENQAVCDIPPFSTCNDVFGASVGRGSFTWKTGARTTVSQRVRLNDAGQANGEIQLFVAGQSVINVGGLVIRNSTEGRFRGMQFQTFFGGSDSSWATPTDQDAYFSDFSVAITELL